MRNIISKNVQRSSTIHNNFSRRQSPNKFTETRLKNKTFIISLYATMRPDHHYGILRVAVKAKVIGTSVSKADVENGIWILLLNLAPKPQVKVFVLLLLIQTHRPVNAKIRRSHDWMLRCKIYPIGRVVANPLKLSVGFIEQELNKSMVIDSPCLNYLRLSTFSAEVYSAYATP